MEKGVAAVAAVAAVADGPSAQAASTRLLKNREDIGNAVVPYWRRWDDAVATFEVFTQAMMMADALADGIAKQFPTRVSKGRDAARGFQIEPVHAQDVTP